MFNSCCTSLRQPEKLLVFIIAIFLTSEVASGMLRFYFSQLSLVQLIYVPKLLMVVSVGYVFFKEGFSKVNLAIIALIVWGAVLGLARGTAISNIIFSIYVLFPLIFGVVCGQRYGAISGWLSRIIFFLFLLLFLGLVIDYFFSVPWKGFEYQIGDSVIEGSREWSTAGVDRLAGFSRVSASAGILSAIFAAYLSFDLKKNRTVIFCLLISFLSIGLTTNKASLLGLFCTVLYAAFRSKKFAVLFLIFGLLLVELYLPFSTIIYDYSADLSSSSAEFFLASFYDRLNRTWPGYIDIVNSYSLPEFGVGLGGVGAALKLLDVEAAPGAILYSLAVADNTALYIWGMFGVFGLFLFFYFGFLINCVQKIKGAEGIVAMLVAILAISITTDVIESPVCLVIIGIALGIIEKKNERKLL